jgi:hypothetical protein
MMAFSRIGSLAISYLRFLGSLSACQASAGRNSTPQLTLAYYYFA